MEKVSIILPVYNCEKWLKYTVASIQNQTCTNWELIIVDDASMDNSCREARNLACEDKEERIKLFHMKKNVGVSACRNLALEKATGRYIAFLDSDDLWSRHKLEHQLEFMIKKDIALSHTSYAFIDEKGSIMQHGAVNVDDIVDLAKYMKTTQIALSSVIIDRNKISDIKFPNDRNVSGDARVWMKLMNQGHKFYGLNEILMLYRIRSGQLSRDKRKMALYTLKRYWHEKNLPAYKRLFYFMNYAYNGVEKRLRRTNVDYKTIYQDFNCRHD